jgi:cytochrome c553
MKKLVLLFFILTIIFSCNKSKNKAYTSTNQTTHITEHPGKKLMEVNCYACHSLSASESSRIAPPMIAIKRRYINSTTTKSDFVANMQVWIKNPNENDAKMFGAVQRFKVMPKLPYPEKTIAQIAEYMYDFDIDKPDWFEAHYKQQQGFQKSQGMGNGQGMKNQNGQSSLKDLPYSERGLKYALTTKSVLGKNLMGAIQEKGTLGALAFCNERAYPLTDSMAVTHNATIKRVSDKPRNPNNQANKKELLYIKTFKTNIKNSIDPKPIVDQIDKKVHVYYPISTNTMCLQCHGVPNQDIQSPTLKNLASLYPQDKAIGYGVDEIRGIWSITFDK